VKVGDFVQPRGCVGTAIAGTAEVVQFVGTQRVLLRWFHSGVETTDLRREFAVVSRDAAALAALRTMRGLRLVPARAA
jgi:hypothetical protein